MVFSFSAFTLFAADRYSVASGNWNSASTWSGTSGGASGASVPVAGDNVFIENGYTVTVTANAACANVTFTGTGASATLTINNLCTLTVSASVTLYKLSSASVSCTVNGSGTLSCANILVGSSTNSPTGNNTTYTHTFNSSVAALNISGNLTVNSYYATTNRRRNGIFNLQAGVATVVGSIVTVNENSRNTSTFSMSSGAQTGTLVLSGSTPFTLSGTGTSDILLDGSSALVNYHRSGNQPVFDATYTNLTISGSGNKTMGGNTSVDGTLTLSSGSFAVGAYSLTLNGPAIAGTPSNLTTTSSSSLVFGGNSGGILIPTSVTALNGLTITNSNRVDLQSSLTVSGTFNPAGGGLSIGSNTLTLNGQINCGTLTGGATSNILIGGSGTASLSAVTLNNLTINRASSMCGNVTVGGTLTLTSGAFTVGAYILTLNGPNIAGTPSNLTTSSASSLVFGGSSPGILVPSSVSNLNNLTLNNQSGITLTGNVTVAGTLTMTQGNISTGSFILIISNDAAGSINRTSGTVIGKLRRAVSTPLSRDYIFPVGTASFYRPAVMNFSALSAGTNITAEFVAAPPAGFTPYIDGTAYLNNVFTEGYWRFYSSSLPVAEYALELTGNGFTSYSIDDLTRITGKDNDNSAWRALGTHGTRSGNEISRFGVSNLNTSSFDFALAAGCYAPWLGYGFERNITIDHSLVAGGADLYSFPVLIKLTGQDFLKTSPQGQVINTNGYDIIFTDESYNKLDHQLEYYDGTNGDLIAWVRIPVLSISSNTIIKILYGNPQVNTDLSVSSVWDSHYKGVWHLDNNNLKDFTSFDQAGTPYNTPTYPAGTIYNALGLNGSNEYVQVNNAPDLNFAGNITVSAWVYMDTRTRDQKIASNQNNSSGGYKFGIYTNNKVEFEIRNAANTASLNRDVAGGTVLSTGQWYYLAGMSSDILDSIMTFVNGIPERPFKKTGTLGIASDNLVIGKEPFESNYYFDGRFDEIRISDKVRSNGWLRTEYNNQSSPSTFYTLDAADIPLDSLPSTGLCSAPITLTFGHPAGGTYTGNPYITGDVFTPPSAGTYTITYTYDAGCGPVSVSKYIKITGIPPAPAASDQEYCINQITYLAASSGENIRWYSGGTLVSTANPFSTGQTLPGTYNYTVTQTINGCESLPAQVALRIYNGITITTQPQPVSISAGDNAVFTVSVEGYNPAYQWQEDGVNISDGGIYSGATTPALTLTNPGTEKNGKYYRCIITSLCGASPLTSTAALLTVYPYFTWTGTNGTDWNSSGNWSTGQIPTPMSSVHIPDVPNKPVLTAGSPGTVKNLTIDSGSSLEISGNTIQISGTITNNGTFTSTAGAIEFNGTAAQNIGVDVFTGNNIKDLIINNPAGVVLQGPLSVTGIVTLQSGSLSSGGYLTLASTATQTGLISGTGTGNVTGNVKMERYLPSGFGYKYFSSPFQAASVAEFGDDMDLDAGFPTLYRYDESRTASGWVDYTDPSGTLNQLTGYAVNFGSSSAPNVTDITGIVNNGSLSATLYNHNNTYTLGFNLVGNPYPSPINWDAPSGWTKTKIDNALYFFRAGTSDEYGGSYSTYINGISSDGFASGIIPSMQGFFVHVTDGTYPVTGVLGLDNRVRVNDLAHSFLKSGTKSTIPLMRLSATFADDTTLVDPLVIYFDEKAEKGFDSFLDALKLMNTDYELPNVYSFGADGSKLSVNALPQSQDTLVTIPLGLKVYREGYIVFKIDDLDADFGSDNIHLRDKLEGGDQDITGSSKYTVFLKEGEHNNRFFLDIFQKKTPGPVVIPEDDIFSIYGSNGTIKVHVKRIDPSGRNTLTITNLAGQRIIVITIPDTGHYEFNIPISRGLFIATYQSEEFIVSKKFLIRD